jgi:hypothetical protein
MSDYTENKDPDREPKHHRWRRQAQEAGIESSGAMDFAGFFARPEPLRTVGGDSPAVAALVAGTTGAYVEPEQPEAQNIDEVVEEEPLPILHDPEPETDLNDIYKKLSNGAYKNVINSATDLGKSLDKYMDKLTDDLDDFDPSVNGPIIYDPDFVVDKKLYKGLSQPNKFDYGKFKPKKDDDDQLPA